MFNSQKTNDRQDESGYASSAAGASATLIAKGVKMEGDFTSQTDVTIEGEVHGTLKTSGKLSVGMDAKIVADVTAGDAIIAGTVQGNIQVANRLELKSSAKIMGDISAEIVSIEGGAALSGRVSIGIKAQPPMPSVNGNGRSRSVSAPKEV